MRAVLQRGFGGPEVLEVADVADPVPAHGEVVVAVRAAALNRLDVQQRAGPAVIPGFSLPHIAGMDVAGEVVELGPGVGAVALGARVVVDPAIPCGTCPACLAGDGAFCPSMAIVGANRPGGFAERCVVPATSVHLVPDHVGLAEAATLPTAWGTAWHALFTTGAVAAGETLLVHAAASGVSLAAIQLAKAAGLRVIATSRSEDRLAVARRLGVDGTALSTDAAWVERVRDLTGGRGVDVVLDHVGPALFQGSLLALRPRGRLVSCGSTTGAAATFDLPHAYHAGIRILGADSYAAVELAAMLDHCWTRGFEAVVDATFPLAELADAQRRLESGVVVGKVLVTP